MITVGVIGYGYWGPNLVRNFMEAPGSRVGFVADLHPDRLAKAAARYPGVKVTTDYRELLADPSIDAVAVATPVFACPHEDGEAPKTAEKTKDTKGTDAKAKEAPKTDTATTAKKKDEPKTDTAKKADKVSQK